MTPSCDRRRVVRHVDGKRVRSLSPEWQADVPEVHNEGSSHDRSFQTVVLSSRTRPSHFYGREGLIPTPPRTSSGYRQCLAETVARLHIIRRAKDLGFSLKEVRELAVAAVDNSRASARHHVTCQRRAVGEP